MKNKIINYCLALVLLLFFVGCRKKYPENTMKLFQNPKGYDLMRGYITGFTVNEVDSLDLLASYQYTSTAMCTDPNVRNKIFQTSNNSVRNRVENDCIGVLEYNWDKECNDLFISHTTNNTFRKNIFFGVS